MTEETGLQTFPKKTLTTSTAEFAFCGRVFHCRAEATGKDRSPMVEQRVRRTTSDDDEAERIR